MTPEFLLNFLSIMRLLKTTHYISTSLLSFYPVQLKNFSSVLRGKSPIVWLYLSFLLGNTETTNADCLNRWEIYFSSKLCRISKPTGFSLFELSCFAWIFGFFQQQEPASIPTIEVGGWFISLKFLSDVGPSNPAFPTHSLWVWGWVAEMDREVLLDFP